MQDGEGWEVVTDEDFGRKVVSSARPVLVELRAEWCGACHILDPILSEVTRVFAGRVKVYRMDVDRHESIAREYGINQVPSLLFFNQGHLQDIILGTAPRTTIEGVLQKLIGSET
jgi:thioredoxin 1